MMRRAVLALACASARGLVPPSLPPPRRASALAVHDPTAWLDALSSLLSAEGPEIEGAGAPVGPIAAATIAVSGYTFEARKARASFDRKQLIARFDKQEALFVPINVYFHSILFSIYGFVGEHAARPAGATREWTSADAVVREFAHEWVWNRPDGLFQLGAADRKKPVATAYELPAELLARVAADPDSELARRYRAWARTELHVPVVRIAEQAYRSVEALEPVPVPRLRELFREPPIGFEDWGFTPRGIFFSMWLAYRRGWDVVFAEWDAGDFSRVRPTAPFPVGLLYYIIECQSIIGAGKKDLLGFSQMDGLRANAGSERVEK